jgi:hypothetical protein
MEKASDGSFARTARKNGRGRLRQGGCEAWAGLRFPCTFGPENPLPLGPETIPTHPVKDAIQYNLPLAVRRLSLSK